MATGMIVNEYNLSEKVDFNSVFRVHDDGTISREQGVYAPDVLEGEIEEPGWSFVDGYSGQQSYSGPIMHESEYLGCGMARDTLATPGVYVMVPAYYTSEECEHCTQEIRWEGGSIGGWVDKTKGILTCAESDESGGHELGAPEIEGWALLKQDDSGTERCGFRLMTVDGKRHLCTRTPHDKGAHVAQYRGEDNSELSAIQAPGDDLATQYVYTGREEEDDRK